jgi:phosphoribosyl 1,2-cyclic phosphodiesterase
VSAIGEAGFEITFHGVRGSTPCHGDDVARYGGNTSCVSVDVPNHDPILLDLGTGARYFGTAWGVDRPFRGHCLLTHLHWDHIQGLPFFPPLLELGSRLSIHAPVQEDGSSVEEVVGRMLRPPMFPVGLDAFPGLVDFEEHADDDFLLGEVRVVSRLVPHLGNTLGFRVEFGGGSVAYISDHQQPGVDVFEATENARELCRGVDVLIHDAQFTREEFVERCSWGHCTIGYAVWLAKECDVKTLVLFHHDPRHDDDQLDELFAEAAAADGVHVIGAREGLTLRVGP